MLACGSTGCPTTVWRTPSAANRYRATCNCWRRVAVHPGAAVVNYHLAHHLHPSVPFSYRYLRTWRRNEEAYLERNAAIPRSLASN